MHKSYKDAVEWSKKWGWRRYHPEFEGMVPEWLDMHPWLADNSADVSNEPWFIAQCQPGEGPSPGRGGDTDLNVNVTHMAAFPAEATPEQLAAPPAYYIHFWDAAKGALVVGETTDPDEAREWTEWALSQCKDPEALYAKYPSSEYGYDGPKTVFTSRATVAAQRLGAPDVQRALGEINLHRARLRMSPLDPAAAGWSDQDVVDEAARIGRLPNLSTMPGGRP